MYVDTYIHTRPPGGTRFREIYSSGGHTRLIKLMVIYDTRSTYCVDETTTHTHTHPPPYKYRHTEHVRCLLGRLACSSVGDTAGRCSSGVVVVHEEAEEGNKASRDAACASMTTYPLSVQGGKSCSNTKVLYFTDAVCYYSVVEGAL